MDPEGLLQKLQILTTYADINSTQYKDIFPDEEDKQRNPDTSELLRLHYKFGHCSFRKIIGMSKQGVIPSILCKANIPV